jgi:hypothetical protein
MAKQYRLTRRPVPRTVNTLVPVPALVSFLRLRKQRLLILWYVLPLSIAATN